MSANFKAQRTYIHLLTHPGLIQESRLGLVRFSTQLNGLAKVFCEPVI